MRILLVEDEQDLSRALVNLLQSQHYEVDPIYDGQEGLDYLLLGSYDAAILDVMLPKMDGFTILKQARQAGKDIPVLMLTARSEIDDRVTGLDLGADDYLTKPFSMKELMARLRSITRRKMESSDSSLRYGDLILDRLSYQLIGPRESMALGNKEYQLMELLMANPNQIVSAEQIFEKIWGLESAVEPNVIWVNLSNLRRKLKRLDSKVLIKASRGLGYSLSMEEL